MNKYGTRRTNRVITIFGDDDRRIPVLGLDVIH